MSYVRVLGITIIAWMANSVVNTALWKTTEFGETIIILISLQWRHDGRDGISNPQPHDCLLNRWFRRRSKKTSKHRVTCLCGIHRSPVNSSHIGLLTLIMFPFDDVIMFFERVTDITLLWGVFGESPSTTNKTYIHKLGKEA